MPPKLEYLIDNLDTQGKQRLIHKFKRILIEWDFIEKNKASFEQLSNREIEVIILVVNGKSNPEIAKALFLSRRTIEQHRKNINRKLQISRVTELNKFAYAFNLV
ncbi:response regulator transcription factor [Flagellimonas sp.]|uniref:response regulator transcription factor n=1 Tax=Flagellimonas sp. TaxID=2058762 RepID=UPI003F4A16BB